jgi:hypothetical protein
MPRVAEAWPGRGESAPILRFSVVIFLGYGATGLRGCGLLSYAVQAVPLTAKLVGAALLLVNVPVKPMVTEPAAGMLAL